MSSGLHSGASTQRSGELRPRWTHRRSRSALAGRETSAPRATPAPRPARRRAGGFALTALPAGGGGGCDGRCAMGDGRYAAGGRCSAPRSARRHATERSPHESPDAGPAACALLYG
eukprot:scaffold107653_cov63-Phaeocystis_antarctica.AAC.2